jgi:tetratricopeptide (TPR) repeat protein
MIGGEPRRIGKGVRHVFEGYNRGISVWLSVAALGICLVLGCSEQQQAVDMYLDAVKLREQGQDEPAVRKLRAVVEQTPDFVLAYSELGKAHLALRQPEPAVEAFRKAAELDPWSFQNHMDMAQTCRDLGRFAEAARSFARAGDLDTENLAAQLGAAQCYLHAGQPARAAAHAESARRIDPQSQEVLRLLVDTYEQQKDYGQAALVYQELLKGDPANLDLTLALARAWMRSRQYERARGLLLEVVQVRPDHSAALRDLGYCLLKLGDADQAMAMYEKAVALDGGDWEAYRGLGVACMVKAQQTGDDAWQSAALRHWRHALAINPDQPRRDWLEKLIRENSPTTNPLRGLDD